MLFFLGRPFGPIYSFIMQLREFCYHKGLLRQHAVPVPIISVGNLVLGGTGKSPVVIHLARLLQTAGYKVAVISRGYGGKARGSVNVVSDGECILLSPGEAGDEPVMIARALPGIPVLTGKKRIHPCRQAVHDFQVEIVLLDDGFQHLGVQRDLDIVLFSADHLAGNSRVFPGGDLREPVSALNRCDYFILTGQNVNNNERCTRFKALLESRFTSKPVFMSLLNRIELIEAKKNTPLEEEGEKYFCFSGIANPSRFVDTLEKTGKEIVGTFFLKDHADYHSVLIQRIEKKARKCHATRLVTTAKDAVKLEHLQISLPLMVLVIEHTVDEPFEEQFLGKIRELCNEKGKLQKRV